MKKSGLILIVLLIITIIGSGCEIKRSEEELREEIKAELEAEIDAEAIAAEEAEKEAAKKAEEERVNNLSNVQGDRTLKIMTERLNVRRDPVLDSVKVGLITNEKTYEFIEEEVRTDGYRWYKVMYETDAQGWIAGWYTLKNSEYTENIGRGKLSNAFEGKLDGMVQALGDNISGYIEAKGDPVLQDGFNGGEVYSYPSLDIFTFGDIGGDIEVGDIAFITFTGAEEMFGLRLGMTKTEVAGIIGEPDVVSLNFTDDNTNLYTNNDLSKYYTGSYNVTLVYSAAGQLERIDLLTNE